MYAVEESALNPVGIKRYELLIHIYHLIQSMLYFFFKKDKFKKKFIYLFGYAGSSLQHAGSLVEACELLVAACMRDLVP